MKKNIQFIKYIIIIIILIIILTGCSDNKTYKNNGISITMMKGLYYKNHETASIYYENDEIFIIGLEEKFEDLFELDINKETTIEEYATEVFVNSGQKYDLIIDDNLYYFTYEYEIDNHTYYYVSTLHKSNKGFWVCNFVCEKKNKDKYHNLFINWAKSIEFY